MRRIWIAVTMLAAITALSVWWVQEAEAFTGQAASYVEQAQQSAQEGDMDAAHLQIQRAQQVWDLRRGLYGAMMRHQEADEITMDFAAAEVNAGLERREEFLVLCAQLLTELHHIADMERPRLYNIL